MANKSRNSCSVCSRRIPANACSLKCDCCLSFIHKNCTTLLKNEIQDIVLSKRPWSCLACNESNFAFNHLHEESDFLISLSHTCTNAIMTNLPSDKIFMPYDLDDDTLGVVEHDDDINPDIHYFGQQPELSNLNSDYYLEKEFSKYVSHLQGKEKQCTSLVHANIRSINANISKFQAYINSLNFNFNFIGFTETWLKDDTDLYNIQGYCMVNNVRNDRQGGGVSILIQDHIPYKIRSDLSIMDEVIECIFVEAALSKKVLVGVVYRPPGRSIDDFNEQLRSLFEKISNTRFPCYLMGDVNINLINHASHQNTGEYLDLIYSNGYIPVINRPTRVTSQTATLIDHIVTNNFIGKSLYQGVLLTDITDHYPIFSITHDDSINLSDDEYIVYRNMKSENFDRFYHRISEIEWTDVINNVSCEHAFTLFHEKMKNCFNQSFPVQKVKRNYKNRIPWLTDELKASIKTKNKLYVKSKKHDTAYNKAVYKNYRCNLDKLLKKQEKDFYNDLITKNKSNMKKTWDVIKTVINKKRRSTKYSEFLIDGSLTDDRDSIANKFNEYFCNIGPNLAKKIPSSCVSFKRFLHSYSTDTIFLNDVEDAEIRKIILSLKEGAPGVDDITAKALKHVVDFVVPSLSHICKLSLEQGHFPKELKLAKIIPLYKSNDPSHFNNYRPISLLSVFSKIMEKVMYDRLYDYLTTLKILYEYQFGFQKNKSTYMALISLTDKITKAMENGEFCIGIFIDFRKAFDTVDHSILLDKLYHYGIRGVAHDWLSSYLTDRLQFVEYNDTKSKTLKVKCGVPQGSNLGPLLFLLYINDLAFVSPKLFAVLFADDSNFFCTGLNLQNLYKTVNSELDAIVNWLNANKMSLNVEKTHFMIFHPKGKKINYKVNINILGTNISEVTSTKFLGVIIDSNLSWKLHIDHICSKISKSIGIIKKARQVLAKDTLLTLYYSFVYPYLNYCVHIWGSSCDAVLKKILLLQKKAVRIICGVNRLTHSEPLFNSLSVLTITKLYKYNIGLLMYKYHHGLLPQILDMFQRNMDVHQYNTRLAIQLHVPIFRTELGKRSFHYQAVKIWNEIYSLLAVDIKIGTFKRKLKSFLIKN